MILNFQQITTRTLILSGIVLLLSGIITAEPVKTFPELLEKIKEHREMIKDVSGGVTKAITNDSSQLITTEEFIYVDGDWKIGRENISIFSGTADETHVGNGHIIQFTDEFEFSYSPSSKMASLRERKKNDIFSPIHYCDLDPVAIYGVDAYQRPGYKIEELTQKMLHNPDTVLPFFSSDGNLLLVTIKHLYNNDEQIWTDKLWFDPQKQYSLVRHQGQWTGADTLIDTQVEMLPFGDPPVYFPKTFTEKHYIKEYGGEYIERKYIVTFDNIKINTGLTTESVKLLLPKNTSISYNNTHYISSADNVGIEQIITGKNILEDEKAEDFYLEQNPAPTRQNATPLLTWRFWVYVIEFIGLGLLVQLLARYRSSKRTLTSE